MQRLGQKDIAERLGISQSTVSAVLSENSSIKISEATRKRVLEEADRVNYWPNRAASALLSRKTGMISIIHVGNYLQTQMEKVIYAVKAIEEIGYTPLIHELMHGVKDDYMCQYLRDTHVDGLLIVNSTTQFMEKSFVKYLEGAIPTVAIDNTLKPSLPSFNSNRRQGFRILAEHLISLGYRKIAALCRTYHTSPYIELNHNFGVEFGVRDALERAGLEPPIIHYQSGPISKNYYQAGRESMASILDAGHRPEAVVCANDSWAIGAMSECLRRGMRLPHDIAFTGFHDELQAAYAPSPLTTAQTALHQLIPKAAKCLADWLKSDGGPVIPPSLTLMDCQLVVRSSCGAPLHSRSQTHKPA